MFKFAKRVLVSTKNKVKQFFTDLVHHTESVIILGAASLGFTAMYSELPMLIALPLWIEASMVIPVLAVLSVIGLTKMAEWRSLRRTPALRYI